jgi:hypothetical protein
MNKPHSASRLIGQPPPIRPNQTISKNLKPSKTDKKAIIKNEIEIGEWKIGFNDFQILYGRFNNIPKTITSIVKIFLSSTFSDFKCERNILYSLAFPKIKEFCAQLDLDFQVVDMR